MIVVNGAPHVVDLYVKDGSLITGLRELEAIPQHCPKVYLFAERGTEDEWLGAGSERLTQYGDATFDERSKFFTHGTRLSNVVNAQGNACMYKRVVPPDAGPTSNYTLWLDLLPTTVDLYERNTDGSIRTVGGQPVITGTAQGYKYMLVKTYESNKSAFEQSFGTRSIVQGSQVDPRNPTVRSVRYPILDRSVSSRGSWGNNIADRWWGLDERKDSRPDRLVAVERAFPYFLQTVERNTKLSTLKVEPTTMNSQYMMFTFKPNSVDPATNADVYLASAFKREYFQTDTRYPVQSPSMAGLAIYQDNIDAILSMLHAAEAPFIDAEFHDFTADPNDKYLFNFLGGNTMNGMPYHTYVPVDGGLNVNRYEALFAEGGSDGTLSRQMYEDLVVEEVARYADDYDHIQDKAYHVESDFYDTGFSLPAKQKLAKFIALRGDLFITFATFQEGERSFDNSEELSIAQTIKASLMNLPESVYYGTSVMRAGIYGGDCELRSSNSGVRVSTVLEVAHKRARYMGSSDGRWKTGLAYDQGSPGSLAEITTNFSKLWVPVKVRYRFWDAGLNWWGRMDRSQAFCPAFKTVYEYETSVLTGDVVAHAICSLNKMNDRSHRAHSGTTGKSDATFTRDVKLYLAAQAENKFDNRFPIEPVAEVTASDKARGSISWHSGYKIWADPQRTVAINTTEVFRNDAS